MSRPPAITHSSFRSVPRTGVIYVMSEAAKSGFELGHADWCNLGQGQPDTGVLPDAPPRVRQLSIDVLDQDYAPVGGLWELREAIASYYNQTLRTGLSSKYSAENVAVCGGGRLSLMRACASISSINLGHFLPDYTAYEELLDVFKRFTPIPIALQPDTGYAFSAEELEREILGRGLGALLLSNPCNPTGKLIAGEQLARWVSSARRLNCTLLIDEFYSHYIWKGADAIVSAASHVEDVERDPVVIFDGLTKNWRYPGWRVTWAVGPRPMIEAMTSAGSFLDGGGARPMQRAAQELLTKDRTLAETAAIRQAFAPKRRMLLDGLKKLGVRVDPEPEGTFYVWGDLSQLPEPLANGEAFFRAALQKRVITVPGEFFDVDPGKRRNRRASRFRQHVRFSFGPDAAQIERALARLTELVLEAR